MKDFGEITLSGASALRTLASAVTLPGPAWYWACFECDAQIAMYYMATVSNVSSVGFYNAPSMVMATGFTASPRGLRCSSMAFTTQAMRFSCVCNRRA